MNRIFVSYPRTYINFTSDLVKNLGQQLDPHKINVWIDQHLSPGENWEQEIDSKIRQSVLVVLIWGADSSKSVYVNYEWAFALGSGIPVIPIRLDNTEIHPRLTRIQECNFTDGKYPIVELAQEIIKKSNINTHNNDYNLSLETSEPYSSTDAIISYIEQHPSNLSVRDLVNYLGDKGMINSKKWFLLLRKLNITPDNPSVQSYLSNLSKIDLNNNKTGEVQQEDEDAEELS